MKGKCIDNSGYLYTLTLGKIYELEILPGIFSNSPYYSFVGDDGVHRACHTYRFDLLGGDFDTANT